MDKLVYAALINYYSILEKVGYKKYSSVFNLLILSYIQDIINCKNMCLTEDDYKVIIDALYYLSENTCEIPHIYNACVSNCNCNSNGSYLTTLLVESDVDSELDILTGGVSTKYNINKNTIYKFNI